ncbi:MAG: SGNH/GDSL hydrolase family protein, partial [Candidatus Melainabacteria bacterium]|nr:SGNH/GDSL hydrolase family protein [Candidatus Melainabacteria bacterium]
MPDVATRQKSAKPTDRHLSRATVALMSLGYFAASLAIIVAAVFALDRWIIPALENQGYLESYLWTDENHRFNHFTYLKNDARKEDPVWRSQYIPVAPEHAGKKRILVIGDSFVWGDGSNNVNTLWWRQLEIELKRRGYNQVEVIAAGLNGASTHDEAKWLSTLLPKYKPDLVVFGYVTNDPEEKKANGHAYVSMLSKEIRDDDPILSRVNSILPNLTGQLRQIRKLAKQSLLSDKTGALEYADWELAILKGEGFQSYKNTVNSLAVELKAANAPAFVITLPAGFQNKTRENTGAGSDFFERVRKYNAERYAAVKPVFKDAGLLFVDTSDAFAKTAAGDPLLRANNSALRLGINPGNGHPGPFSTHFYAVSCADVIESHFPEAAGEKAVARPPQAVEINDCMPPYMNARAVSADTIAFTYPPDVTEHTLHMPLRRRHVQLSLKEPVSVTQIELSGPDLKSAQVYVSYLDEKLGYSPDIFEALPLKKGGHLSWSLATGKR